MSKRKKVFIKALIFLAVLYFLLIGGSYFFLRAFIFPSFSQSRAAGAYPYSDAAIPEDFAEYAAAGLKLDAPNGLDTEISNAEISIYLSHDTSQYDLQITAFVNPGSLSDDVEHLKANPSLLSKWITGCGWLTKLGMKKIGYKVPESNNELLYLLNKIDAGDYNKFSLTESYAFTKLAVLGAFFIPAMISDGKYDTKHPLETPLEVDDCFYYLDADTFHAILRQGRSAGGRYRLEITYYPVSDQENVRNVLILSDDPALVQTIAASVQPA